MNVSDLIDLKIPNLHTDLKDKLVIRLTSLLPCKKGILYSELNSFKREHNIIAIGKFTKKYWLSRGWPENQILELTKKNSRNKDNLSSPMKIDHWLNRINPLTGLVYTKDEATLKIKSFRKLNNEYWINLGFSKEEAEKKVRVYQQENGNKFSRKNKDFPERYASRTWTQLDYWIKLGYSIDNAKKILSSNQDKTSLFSFISRYGEEEGNSKYEEYLNKISYTASLEYYINKFGETDGFTKYEKYLSSKSPKYTSKESLKFFIPLYKKLRTLGFNKSDIFWGIAGSKEYYLYDSSANSIFFYDLCIPKIKKIVEYHGVSFHPNPSWKKEKIDSWKCPFLNLTAAEKLKIDQYKENFAKSQGFDVLLIWSDSKPDYETILNFLIK